MTQDTIELPYDTVEDIIERLEKGMKFGEMAHSHDEIRGSSAHMAQLHKDAYQLLIEDHPDYDLVAGGDLDE